MGWKTHISLTSNGSRLSVLEKTLDGVMPDSGTVIVFKILGVLANARHGGHVLHVDEIAAALRLGKPRVEQYMAMLQRAGAVRAEAGHTAAVSYSLTRYGLTRLPRSALA
jgi:DNA-binding IclR family transcriptional regulator